VGYFIGIDLGTTFSALAVARDGNAEIVTVGHRGATVPSLLFLKDDGTFVFGDAAARRGVTDPGRLAREFKRRFGDTTPLILGGTPFSADALSAQLLRHLLAEAVEQQGKPPDKVAVTHPANWGPYKIDLLRQSIAMADIPDYLIVSEPEAAAIHYGAAERLEPGEVVAIYDLGGGTFDAAVLESQPGRRFSLLGPPEGIERLGGIDFDEAIVSYVAHYAGPALSSLDPSDPAALSAMARLRADCVAAKETLSSDTEAQIPVLLPSLQTEVRVTRSEFEAMIRPTLSETVDALRRALRGAGVSDEDLKAVVLVGGSSRIPLVGQLVAAELGRPVAVDVHPKHAVALGAALAAGAGEGDIDAGRSVSTRGAASASAAPGPGAATVASAPAAPAAPVPAPAPAHAAAPDPAAAAVPAKPRRARLGGPLRRRALVASAAAAVIAVAAILAVVLSSGGHHAKAPPPPKPDVPTFGIPGSVASLVAGAGALWGSGTDGMVYRFDPSTHTVAGSVDVAPGGSTVNLAFGAGSVWAAAEDAGTVSRIDPASNSVTARYSVGHKPHSLLFAAGSMWVAVVNDGVVTRIDPTTGTLTPIHVRGQPTNLAYGSATVWVTDPGNGSLIRIDPAKNNVNGDARTGGCPDYLAADDTAVWVEDECKINQVFKVDPANGQVVGSATVGRDAKGVILAGGSLWVANVSDNTVSQVDTRSLATVRTIHVAGGPSAFAADNTGLWVNSSDNMLSRINF
jgi:YVTN family beta-propeller protein